ARAQAWLGELHVGDRNIPDGMQRGGGASVYALQFGGVKPDAATAAVTDVEGHAASAFLAQRVLADRAFHGASFLGLFQVFRWKFASFGAARMVAQADCEMQPNPVFAVDVVGTAKLIA